MKDNTKDFFKKHEEILTIIGAGLVIVLYIALWFTPKMGKNVMIDEILNFLMLLCIAIYFLGILVLSIVKKEFAASPLKAKAIRILMGVVGVVMLVFAVSSAISIVSDLSGDTEIIELTNVEFYETKSLKKQTKYTIEGTNLQTGEYATYQVDYEACEKYVGSEMVYLEIYPKTERVVDCY